jgi:hypothetical protein
MKAIPKAAIFICLIGISLSALAADGSDLGAVARIEEGRQPSVLPSTAGVVLPEFVLEQNNTILGLSQKIDNANDSLTSINSQVAALKQSFWERLYPAIIAFLGVFIAGGVSYLLQARQLEHNENERKAKFSFDIRQKLFEYRSKQNNEFYGPLLVLLTQSKELSKQLHEQLAKIDSSRYQFEDEQSLGGTKPTLFIHAGTDKLPFRLIEEMPYLGRNVRSSLPQVNVVIEVGERMAALIEKSSGLANPKNTDLNVCLGVYLAHLIALKDAYSQAIQEAADSSVRIHTAVFPRNIQDLVKKDYDEINRQVEAWKLEAETPAESV